MCVFYIKDNMQLVLPKSVLLSGLGCVCMPLYQLIRRSCAILNVQYASVNNPA